MRVEAFQTDDMCVLPSTGTFASNHPETKRTIEMLDANYKKANLPEFVKETFGHSSPIEQIKLLLLNTKCN